MNDFDKYKKIRLVPVEVFGAEDGYGLMDAVEAWSDCNRAYGKIYRVDDIESRNGETVEVLVKTSDLSFFDKQFESDKSNPKNFLSRSKLIQIIEGMNDGLKNRGENIFYSEIKNKRIKGCIQRNGYPYYGEPKEIKGISKSFMMTRRVAKEILIKVQANLLSDLLETIKKLGGE